MLGLVTLQASCLGLVAWGVLWPSQQKEQQQVVTVLIAPLPLSLLIVHCDPATGPVLHLHWPVHSRWFQVDGCHDHCCDSAVHVDVLPNVGWHVHKGKGGRDRGGLLPG